VGVFFSDPVFGCRWFGSHIGSQCPKDPWTLKSLAILRTLPPAIQVQTLLLEGPRSLGWYNFFWGSLYFSWSATRDGAKTHRKEWDNLPTSTGFLAGFLNHQQHGRETGLEHCVRVSCLSLRVGNRRRVGGFDLILSCPRSIFFWRRATLVEDSNYRILDIQVVVSNIFDFHPYILGELIKFDEHIFQMGWVSVKFNRRADSTWQPQLCMCPWADHMSWDFAMHIYIRFITDVYTEIYIIIFTYAEICIFVYKYIYIHIVTYTYRN